MKKPVAPDWLKEAIKNTRYDQLDPATKKAADRFMRELRKWERGGIPLKTIKETQKQNKKTKELERKKRDQELTDKITQRWNDADENEYKNILREQESTIDWNWGGGCKWCECQSLRVVKTPQYKHWGKFVCNLCHRYNDWIPYPKEGSVPFVDRSKTIECEFK